MELIVDRKWKKQSYTISNLTIDGKWFCNVLEDADRGLDDSMSIAKIRELKKPSITAIPKGTYEITLDVISPKYCTNSFYKQVCNGKVPRLLNVKGFEGILIHAGNTDKDSAGCLLVGINLERGKVLKSQETFRKLYKMLSEAKLRGEYIQITIK
jgi:hypothetical protein